MRVVFWNVRGLGAAGRQRQLREMVFEQKVDIICLQETIKQSFTDRELRNLVGDNFTWRYVAAVGHSGGIMTGVKELLFDIVDWDQGAFSLRMVIKNKKDGQNWELINVYGPAQQAHRGEFLAEIGNKVQQGVYPMILGGDFNLYRYLDEKSGGGGVDVRRTEAFNNFINHYELQELFKLGGKFTWTNKQINPIRCVLDRILVTSSWDHLYPLAIVSSLLRVGSDHCPLLLDTREGERVRGNNFRFEMGWFELEGFKKELLEKWPARIQSKIMDYWHLLMPYLRRWLRGWSANMVSKQKKRRKEIEQKLTEIDNIAKERDLFPQEWEVRYELEKEVEQIYLQEELWWQRRGGEQWLLRGDSNTSFFHRIANGRNRKSHIFSIQQGEEVISDFQQIQTHIYDYYKQLFGREELRNIHLEQGVWANRLSLNERDNESLMKPFELSEIDQVMKSMKTNTAPGPDGFPVGFYKKLWPEFRGLIKEMLDDLQKGILDSDRINYGVISLLPKIKDANTIKQYRPICLQNVILKILTKALTMRITSVIGGIINWTQTAFIPGRYILDGCVILYEVLHELHKKKESGVIFKIDFEKAYDRVQWWFLYEVMQKKNFNSIFIEWIKKITEGG
jgi:exonuclease III